MILIFDCETTGFPLKGKSCNFPKQSRIMQLAWVLLDDTLQEVDSFAELIIPTYDHEPHRGALEAHGKTREMCLADGVNIDLAMFMFHERLHSADLVVAHNIAFDKQLIDIERDGLGYDVYQWNPFKHICTMELMTPICQMKGGRFGSKWKWPKLQEAYEYCFKESFAGAHDALHDVRATVKILEWLIDNGHICPTINQTQPTLTA